MKESHIRLPLLAPPPFYGTSRYSLLNVDKEEQSTRDEKCVATTRDREIEALERELEELRARLRAAQEDAANESKRLKDSVRISLAQSYALTYLRRSTVLQRNLKQHEHSYQPLAQYSSRLWRTCQNNNQAITYRTTYEENEPRHL